MRAAGATYPYVDATRTTRVPWMTGQQLPRGNGADAVWTWASAWGLPASSWTPKNRILAILEV